jgi:hypothetical protein
MGGGGSGVTDNRRAVCAVLVRVCGVRVSGVRVSASKRLTQGMMLPRSTPQLHVDAPGPWRHDTRAHGDSCMGLLGLQFTARPRYDPLLGCGTALHRAGAHRPARSVSNDPATYNSCRRCSVCASNVPVSNEHACDPGDLATLATLVTDGYGGRSRRSIAIRRCRHL